MSAISGTPLLFVIITKYGSTLYKGMDEILAHYACTFKNSAFHFHFSDNPLLTPLEDSQG